MAQPLPAQTSFLDHYRSVGGLAALLVLLGGCAATKVEPPPPPPPAPPPVVQAPVAEPPPKAVLPIAQTPRGVQIVLPDSVLFQSGKADLNTADSGPYLDRIARLLTTKTEKRIAIEGHTDNVGNAALNQRLSEQRAEVVAKALIARGVPAARVSQQGMSFKNPVAPNDLDAGRRLNRRTEVIVLDEHVATITAGEPSNSFEDAVARVKAALEAGRPR